MPADAGAWNIGPATLHPTRLKIPLDFLGLGGAGNLGFMAIVSWIGKTDAVRDYALRWLNGSGEFVFFTVQLKESLL